MKRLFLSISSFVIAFFLVAVLMWAFQLKAEAATVMFSDDFESENSDQWTEQAGTWSVIMDGGTYVYSQATTSSPSTARAYVADPTAMEWTDYVVQARVQLVEGTYAMLMARYQDSENYYLMALRSSNKIEIKKQTPTGSGTAMGGYNTTVMLGQWYTMALEVNGNTVIGYLDGAPVITMEDNNYNGIPAFITGTVGVGTSGARAMFDDVVVTDLRVFTLTVNSSGTGAGTVTSDPAGINCGATCEAGFVSGTVVTLTATATTGSFAGWVGAGCSGTGDCVVTMDQAKDVTAVFSSSSAPSVIVHKDGAGSGTVTSDPAGVNCGTACTASFTQNTVVTLTATPATYSSFTGWSGACSGTGPCVLTMDAAKTVTATFIPGPFPVEVIKLGNGTGSVASDPLGIDCGVTCTAGFAADSVVTLTATADGDSTFVGWDGAGCSGTGDCTMTMTAATDITATFMALTQTLSIAKTGNGTGSVTSDPAGIACGATCTEGFSYGASITLTATPDGDSLFTGWSGACSGTGVTCTVTMDDTKGVTAAFMSLTQTLSVITMGSGTGSVTSDPPTIDCGATCSANLSYGTNVTLTATPDADSSFLSWSGSGCSGAGGCIVAMTDTMTITAVFEFNFTLPFTDDFESGAGKWTEVNGDWSVVDEGGNHIYHQDETTAPSYKRSVVGAPTWTDYSIQARVRPGASYGKLIARYQDPAHYYLMAVRADSHRIEFKKMVTDGGTVGLGSGPVIGISSGTWYTATFEVEGNELRGYINGVLMYTTTDNNAGNIPPYSWGKIGLGTHQSIADFDDVLVISLVPTYTLSVATTGSGSGSVASDPVGVIDCGITCTATLERGTVVTLTATPDVGDAFAGWMGACSGTGDCVVTMDAAKNVTAVFSSSSDPMLIVYKSGTGMGMVTSEPAGIGCGGTCVVSFTQNTVVTLTATPDTSPMTYSTFSGWSGACSGTGDCVVTMDAAKSVTATFTFTTYELTVNKAGNASGTVTSDPVGISCGITCTATMGGVVTLTATPDDTLVSFAGWDGACSGTDDCVLTMNAAKNVTATFMTYVNYLPLIMSHIDPVIVDPLYVAPGGSDSDPGTIDKPFATLSKAVSVAVAGQTIYMRGGPYNFTATVLLDKSGNPVNMYKIWAYPGELPVIDFSGSPVGARGFLITGNFWYLKGLEIHHAEDNGIKIDGSHNIVERCILHHNQDTGLQIGLGSSSTNPYGMMAAYNQIINCDSYLNFDIATGGGNADGFACKLHAGKGNSFTGCRAWENSDDGWDLFDTDHPVTIENSWTWHNGDPALFGGEGGNGNGFKVGGNYDNAAHILTGCIAFDNAYSSGKGFDQNHNMSGITVYHSVAWGNLTNFSFNETPNDGSHHILKNNVSFNPVTADTSLSADTIQEHNSWNPATGVTADATDFITLTETLAKAPRQADGSLPDNGFARLVAGSDLIDAGTDVGRLPICGSAPDLGAFEYCSSPDLAQAPQPVDGSLVLGSGLVGLGAYGNSMRRRRAESKRIRTSTET